MSERITVAEYKMLVGRRTSPAARQNKFGARSITIDGHYFPSLLEGRRYGQLKMMQRTGLIRELKLQPRFDLSAAGEKVAEYRADFAYQERFKDGDTFGWLAVVEDAKGVETPLYKLKRALFLRLYPHFAFREIKRHGRTNPL